MSLSTKILIIVGTIISLCIASLIVYKQFEISAQQNAIQTEMVKQKELQNGIIRSLNEYATKKDIEQFAKNNNISLKTITEDMNRLDAEIKAINIVTANSKTPPQTNMRSTSTGAKNPNPQIPTVNCNGKVIPCPDQFGYLKATQNYRLYERFGEVKVPIGTASFSAWREAPWDEVVSPRQYKVSNVVGVDENQRQYFYNKFSVTTEGKTYDIKIDSAETKQEYPMAKFNWFNPRVFLTSGISLNVSQIKPSFNAGVTANFISYGKYKKTPTINFMQIGAGYQSQTNEFAVIINPVNFNIGDLASLKIISNTYVGPTAQITSSGKTFIGANVSVGL